MKVVRSGRWLYDESIEKPVDVVGFDFDWWYELDKADGQLDPGEEPAPLGENGLLYYVRFREAGDPTLPTWVDSPGYPTIADAVAEAESKAPSPIQWL